MTDPEQPSQTAPMRAADAVSEEVFGEPVKARLKKAAHSLVHYATGVIVGGLYGLVGGRFLR